MVVGIPRRRLGRFGLELTEISLGAAFIGGRTDPLMDDPEAMTRRLDGVAVAAVQRALELGISHIDTSPLYAPSERRIGMALAEVEAPGLTISTKVGTHAERRYSYTADDIRWSLDESLKLLGRDRVDIVLIHDPPTMGPVFTTGDGFDALDRLRDEGLLDYVGLGARDIPFHEAAIESGRVDVILTFADYNLVRRQAAGLIDKAAAAGVGVLLGSPQMLGLLAKGDPQETARMRGYGYFPEEDVRWATEWWAWCREREVEFRHLNMRYVLDRPGISTVLSGAATAEEIATNVREARTRIPDEIWGEALARVEALDARGAGSA